MTLTSMFQPTVNLDDDGNVTIDWADSYCLTYDEEAMEVVEIDDPHNHGEALDKILGIGEQLSPADMLRRLATVVEASQARLSQDL